MQKITTLFTLLLISLSAFAQSGNTAEYDELMRKSRSARTISTIFVATGPVIAAGGIGTLIYGLVQNDVAEADYYYDINGNYVEAPGKSYTKEITIGAIGAAVGIAVALTSIAFSNKASNYKREARKLKMKTAVERISIPGMQHALSTRQYKLSLVVPLGR